MTASGSATLGWVVVLALAASAPRLVHADESLGGIWETPVGKVRVEADGEGWLGLLQDPSKVCGFPRGTEVLRGRMGDGVFLGELRVCFVATCKEREGWLFVMAQPVGGERLSGAAALVRCVSPAFRGGPFVLVRESRGAEPAAPVPVAAPVVAPERESPTSSPAKPQRQVDPRVREYRRKGADGMRNARYEEARRNLMLAAEIEPRNPDVLTQIGVTWYARRDFERATTYYRKALAADGSFSDAHYNLACALSQQGRSKDALKSLKAAADTGFHEVHVIDYDRELDPLRQDPAFQEIRNRVLKNKASR